MGEVAVQVRSLAKQYQIGRASHQNPSADYKLVRDMLTDTVAAPLRCAQALLRRQALPRDQKEMIWALQDISFEVKRGEIVGIIGRNGSGKSTLLRILSRITEPTHGEAILYGQVGSMLEVGAGFHPELTGRENIYLSGTILGMKRAENCAKA